MPRLVIFTNGLVPDIERVRRLLRQGDTLLAADGGTCHARALGLTPSIIIGDLDSLTFEEREWAAAKGVQLLKHPSDKNETDLELALNYATQHGFLKIVIIGALGGRLDQTLGNLALLTNPVLENMDVRCDDGVEEVWFVRDRCKVNGNAGDIVSLLPWYGEVTGITTGGLCWSLHGETLYPHKTRGVSNEMLGRTASIVLQSGLLLVVHRRLTIDQ